METKKMTECCKTYLRDVKDGLADNPSVIAYAQFGISSDCKFVASFTYGEDNNVLAFLTHLKDEHIPKLIENINSTKVNKIDSIDVGEVQ